MWRLQQGQIFDVVSPVEGTVVYTTMLSNGANIIVETSYSLSGQRVFYQLVHFATIDSGVIKGARVKKGQHIGTHRWDGAKDPGGYSILDFMLYRGDSWIVDNNTEEGKALFFNTAPYHLDDLALIPHSEVARCEGNPRDYINRPK
jgi:hypothetical protein